MPGQVKRKKSKQSKTGHTPPTKSMSKMAAVTTTESASTPATSVQVSEVIAQAHNSLYSVSPESSMNDNCTQNVNPSPLNVTHVVETGCKQTDNLNRHVLHDQAVSNSVSGILPDGSVHASYMSQCMLQPVSHSTPSHVSTECKQNVTPVISTTAMPPPPPSLNKGELPMQYPSPPPYPPPFNVHAIVADMHVMCEKINNMERYIGVKLAKLDLLETICSKFEHLEKVIFEMKGEIEEVRNIQKQHDHTMKEAKQQQHDISDRVKSLEHENRYLENEYYELKETYLRFQTHSMKYNIIFGGIPCTDEKEDTEVVLKTFLKEELDIQEADNIIFQNVHRLRPRTDGKPRSIIARFNRFNDHDRVFKAVPVKLRNKPQFSVHQQYPYEINQRRSKLIPKLKELQRRGIRAKLVYDEIKVNGRPYEPPPPLVHQSGNDATGSSPNPQNTTRK